MIGEALGGGEFCLVAAAAKERIEIGAEGVVLWQGGDVQLAHFEIGELAGRGFSAFDNGDVGVPVIPLDGAEDLLHRPFWPFQILPETPVIVDQQAADFASEVADAGDDQQRADFFGAHEAGGVTSVEVTEKFLVVAAGAGWSARVHTQR